MEFIGASARRERRGYGAFLVALVLMIVGVPAVAGRSVATAAAHRSHCAVAPSISNSSSPIGKIPDHHCSPVSARLAMSSQFRVGLTFSLGLIIIGGIAIFLVARRRH